ncbi:MAG: VOC family protein [Gaiella sp.]
MRLQHVALVVTDVAASRRFYGEGLGLEEIPRPAAFRFGGAWFRAGDDHVHLIARADTTEHDLPPDPGLGLQAGLATHIAFEVDDLAGAEERLGRHGVPIAAGRLLRGDGVQQTYFRDPDGNIVELFQLTGEDQSGTVRDGAVILKRAHSLTEFPVEHCEMAH